MKQPNISKRIIKNAFSLFFSGVASQILIFSATIYLARILGVENFGKINFAIAFSAYFMLISDLGLPLFGTREIARHKEKTIDYINGIVPLRLCLSLIGFSLFLILVIFLNKPKDIKVLLFIYGLGLFPSAIMLDWVFQGLEKMEYMGLKRISLALVYALLIFIFIKNPNHLFLIPCFHIIGSSFAALILIFIIIKFYGKLTFKLNFFLWKKIIKQSLPLGISIVLAAIIYNVDVVMLGFMKTEVHVGYYTAAYKIIYLLMMTGAVYLDVIFPVLSNYYKTSLDFLEKIMKSSSRLFFTIVFPIAIGGTILSGPIMNLFYGSEYDQGVIALKILFWVVAFMFLNGLYGRALWACDKQNKYLQIIIIQTIVNISFNLFLIPRYGIEGAAISTVITEIVGIIFYYNAFCKIAFIPLQSYIFKPLFTSILMGGLLWWGSNNTDLNIFILSLSGIVFYFFIFYLIGGIKNEDMKLIKTIIFTDR